MYGGIILHVLHIIGARIDAVQVCVDRDRIQIDDNSVDRFLEDGVVKRMVNDYVQVRPFFDIALHGYLVHITRGFIADALVQLIP